MKRTLFFVLIVMALVFTACASPTTAPTTAPQASSSSAPAPTAAASSSSSAAPAGPTATPAPKYTPVPVPAGATKFDFWHAMSGTNGDAITDIMGKFNLSQTKCYGTPIFQGAYDDELNKIKAGLASKDVPALAQMYDLATGLMVDLKVVDPMQNYIDKDKFDLSNFEPNVLGYYTVGGKLYGMPWNTSAPILYYNKTLFKAAGLDPDKPPRTYADVLDYAKKLTKKDANGKVTVAGYGIAIYGWIFEQLLATSGGMYLNNDNGRSARATAATFNSPEGIAAVQFWKDGVDAGAYQNFGVAPNGTNAVVAAFQSQQVAMYIESTARVRAMIDASVAGKFDLGTAYIPRPNEDAYKKAGVIIGGASVYIMNDRPQAEKDCAWQFVKFSETPEIQAYWHTASGYYPTVKTAYDVQLDKDWVSKYPQFLTAVNQLHDSPKIMSSMGGFSGTMQQNRLRIEQAIDSVLAGKATPKDALDAAAKDVTQNLTDYNKTVQ